MNDAQLEAVGDTFLAWDHATSHTDEPAYPNGWSVTNILPPRLQRAGFTLTEDEDFLVLWHEHEFVARFLGIATNMPNIILECDAHLIAHPVVVDMAVAEV